MHNSSLLGIKASLGAVLLAGVVHAAPVTLTHLYTYTGNTSWQDIKSVSANYNDLNGNNVLEVGETVTFSLVMHKQWWGTHDYDIMKVWLDGSSGNNLTTKKYEWDYDPADTYYAPGQWTSYSDKPWTGGDKTFSFNYTFSTAGNFFLTASVMCSADLSTLFNDGPNTFDKPTTKDWNAWSRTAHQYNSGLQGEDEKYKLVVAAPPAVPEPGTLGLMGLGLIGFAALARKRRKA